MAQRAVAAMSADVVVVVIRAVDVMAVRASVIAVARVAVAIIGARRGRQTERNDNRK